MRSTECHSSFNNAFQRFFIIIFNVTTCFRSLVSLMSVEVGRPYTIIFENSWHLLERGKLPRRTHATVPGPLYTFSAVWVRAYNI